MTSLHVAYLFLTLFTFIQCRCGLAFKKVVRRFLNFCEMCLVFVLVIIMNDVRFSVVFVLFFFVFILHAGKLLQDLIEQF